MGTLVEKIGPEVTDEDAARAVCKNRQWTMRIALFVGGVGVLAGYGIFYPGRSWTIVGVAAVAVAITSGLGWLFVHLTMKPQRFVGAIRALRQRGRPVPVFTRRALVLMGVVFQVLTLIAIYFLATTPI